MLAGSMRPATPLLSAAPMPMHQAASRPTDKRGRTRAAILAAAFQVIGREQGRTARIDEIIARAGMSRGTFYNYFTGMEDLFAGLCESIAHSFNEAVLAFVATLPCATDRCAAAMRYYLDRARADGAWGWAMVNISTAGYIFGEETFRHATQSIREGLDSGEFDVDDPELGRDLMLGAVLAAMTTILRGRDDPRYASAIARRVLGSLGADFARIEVAVSRTLSDPESWQRTQALRATSPG